MTTNPTPTLRLRWHRVTPGHGPAYRVLKMGRVTVGKVVPAMTGTGYRAEVFLPGARVEGNGVAGTEAEGMPMVASAVCAWLESAGLGNVGVVVDRDSKAINRPLVCADCTHHDPYNDEAPDGCGHPGAPFPQPAATHDAGDCPGFDPEPYAAPDFAARRAAQGAAGEPIKDRHES